VRPGHPETDRLLGLRGSYALDQSAQDGSAAGAATFYENVLFVIFVTSALARFRESAAPSLLRRSPDWLKMKNPAAPAVKREEEEDWDRGRWR
jgi:hypothetical protein